MNTTKKILGAFVLSVSLSALISCGDSGKDNAENQAPPKDTTSEIVETETVSYSLPSPLQIARIFKKSGLTYMDGLTNDQKDPSKYTSKFSKALNMGIY